MIRNITPLYSFIVIGSNETQIFLTLLAAILNRQSIHAYVIMSFGIHSFHWTGLYYMLILEMFFRPKLKWTHLDWWVLRITTKSADSHSYWIGRASVQKVSSCTWNTLHACNNHIYGLVNQNSFHQGVLLTEKRQIYFEPYADFRAVKLQNQVHWISNLLIKSSSQKFQRRICPL